MPNPAQPTTRPHPLLLAAIAGMVILFLAVTLQKIWAADTWWQLRTGQWIVENRTLPSIDVFSATAAGNPWIEMRWLYCVALYGVWSLGGPGLGVIVQSLMLGLAFGLICWPSRRALLTPMGLFVLALGLVGGMSRWVLRPELVSYVMIPAYLLLLDSATHGRSRRLIWLLPALQVLWTSAHTLFIFGPILAWTFVAGDTARRILPRIFGTGVKADAGVDALRAGRVPPLDVRLAGVAVATTLACWINPYGHAGAMFPFILLEEIRPGHILGDSIAEFRSPLGVPLSAWSWDMLAGLGLAIVTLGTFIPTLRRPDWSRIALFLGGLYVASLAQRNIGILAIFSTWIALCNISDTLAGALPHSIRSSARSPLLAVPAIACLAAAWYIATDRLALSAGAARETGIGLVARNFPTAAVDFALAEGCQPPIYNAMGDGGYLIWRAHGVLPVYSDGRLEVYTNDFFKEYFIDGPANWPEMANRRAISTVIVPVDGYEWLVSSLAASRSWALVHMDHRTVILVRAIPEHADLIARRRIDPRTWTPGGPEPDERPDAWKRAIGAPANPWHSTGMARTLLALGATDAAGVYLQRAVDRGGGAWPRLMLAQIERFRGDVAASDRLLHGLTASAHERALAEGFLATMLLEAGRAQEAIAPLERMAALRPDDAGARLTLARLYAADGNLSSARDAYQRALGAGAGTVQDWVNLGLICERLADPRGAIDAYNNAVAREPGAYQVYNQMGILLARMGRRDDAARCFTRAIEINPDDASARENLRQLQGR